MLTNIAIILWIAFILFAVAVYIKSFNRGISYEFQEYTKTDIPYITIDVQGKLLNIIVDTGCSISIIKEEALKDLHYEISKRKVNLAALTTDSIASDVVKIPFTINNREYIEDFVVYGEGDIANFEVKYGIIIHAIFSKEFFDKTGCKIDFKNHSVIFP